MEFSLTAKEICTIIKACASSGVAEIKVGPLSVQFWSKPTEIGADHLKVSPPQWLETSQTNNPAPTEVSQPEYEQEDLFDLYVRDPAEWERRSLEEDKS